MARRALLKRQIPIPYPFNHPPRIGPIRMSLRRSLLLPVLLLGFLHAYIGWRILPDLPVGLELRSLGVVFLLA